MMTSTPDCSPGMAIAYQSTIVDALFQLSLLSNISQDSRSAKKMFMVKDKEPGKKIAKQRAMIHDLFAPTASELGKNSGFLTLETWIAKETDLQDLLFNTVRREKEAIQLLQTMQNQIALEHKSTQKELHEKESIVQQLKDAIHEIRYLSTSETTFLKNEVSAKHAYNTSTRDACIKSSMIISQTLSLQIENEQEIHQTLIEFLTRQKEKLEENVVTWSQKYETDLDQKTRDLEELKTNRSVATEGYEKMGVEVEKMEKFIESTRIEKLRLLEEKKKDFRHLVAVKKIQKFWRLYLSKKKAVQSGKKGAKKGAKKGK